MTYLDTAIKEGLAKITGEGKKQKITYIPVDHSERYSDPEEKVRAEFWAELIYRYDYPPQRIGVEVTVPDRTPHDRADLVVFEDDERKRPFAVIEVKRDGITDAEFEQAVEQAYGNGNWAKIRAKYVMVVAGATRRALDVTDEYDPLEREKNIIADLPRKYGKPEEYKYRKNTAMDIQSVSRGELIAAIEKSHQTLWGGGQLSPPAAFGELAKIIFVKIHDEKTPRKKGEPYEFQIKTHESSERLAARIKRLYEAQAEREPDVFVGSIMVDDAKLRTVVSHIEGIDLSRTDLDTKGVAFERFMDSFFKGSYGQYFTPREVIQFAVGMMNPTRDDVVLDPACGSGGFLLYALDKVRRDADDFYPEHEEDVKQAKQHERYWHDFAMKQLFGIEINNEIARVAKMNMILHDDGHTNVLGADALRPISELIKMHGKGGFQAGSFDLVLTNPPFGSKISNGERPFLVSYDLGNKTNKNGKISPRKTQKSEVLFIERIWHFLKPGTGRAAIILPDGVLSNSSLQYVRDWLLEHFQLNAVISLPQTAFSHYGAGVKASVIFVRKRSDNEVPSDDEPIFMAAPEKIGYDATGRKTDNHLPDILEQYRQFEENPDPFFV